MPETNRIPDRVPDRVPDRMPDRMKVLIADDEGLARRRIRDMLRDQQQIEIVGECANGPETVLAIEKLSPDLVFLDVQMPGLSGIEIAGALKGESRPMIIFVTAYDQYAVRAFEVHAVDYLLKPFDRQRFAQTIERAKTELSARRGRLASDQILSLLGEMRARPQYLDRLLIRNNDRVFIIKTDEIDWIEAEGNYIRIHFGKQSSLLRETLSNLVGQLDPRKFSRIHRSQIVNVDRIQELQPWTHRDHRIILRNGTQLMLSRTYRDQLYQLLGKL
ncbi:MAG: LytTR family DNA-binding domain-containing protein [Acidobacteriota bacterium]